MPSISAIARDWGVSRPYVSKCVHQRDCPTTSLEAAREWRETCASKRPPTNPKQIARLLEEEEHNTAGQPWGRSLGPEDQCNVTLRMRKFSLSTI
jgi:hypothetical protein